MAARLVSLGRGFQIQTICSKYARHRPVTTVHKCSTGLRAIGSTSSLAGKHVRIGCASGFWGDTAVAAPQLVRKGELDYLVFDYLSEITMSLLTAAKNKVPTLGYTPDFVQIAIGPLVKEIKQKGIRVVSNSGGVNPEACADALQDIATKAGVDLKIATVSGDNLMPQKDELQAAGITEMDSGMPFPKTMQSMSAYLGAGAVSKALDLGADIVITGRCTDSALVLAPLMHSFNWQPEDLDLMAAGSLAGHLIECGAQATGGIFTDWDSVPDWHNIGFPIVEVEENGNFILTKPPSTGGIVSFGTVAEQLVYEIADPANYILPDVVCDFTQVKIEPVTGKAGEAVSVTGARGKPPTGTYKVSGTYADGFRTTAVFSIGGPRAIEKSKKTADAILKRCRGIFKQLGLEDFTNVHFQVLGSEQTYGPHAAVHNTREAVGWLAVHHKQKKALEILGREIAPAGTGMAPGLGGIVGGRPKVSPVLKLFSFLHPKDELEVQVNIDDHKEIYKPKESKYASNMPSNETATSSSETLPTGTHSYSLGDLAYTRSGDKGNNVNIGVVARDPSYLPYIRNALTPEAVANYLSHLYEDLSVPLDQRIQRYDLPGISGLNFVLRSALGGGGIASLRSDPQGKAVGQMLLDFNIENVPKLK